jgi:hypothetical protein
MALWSELALILLAIVVAVGVLGLLLHEVVVLDPEGQGVHDHGDEEHHEHELQLGVVVQPAHQVLRDCDYGLVEPVLHHEQDEFHREHNGVPY